MSLTKELERIRRRLAAFEELPYELRPTASRQSLHRQYLDAVNEENELDPIIEETEPGENSDSSSDESDEINLDNPELPELPNRIPLNSNMATAVITNSTKFTGYIPDKSDPDKARLESYDVHQFLADLDSRIASLNITEEADKIKESQWLIDKDHGIARSVLLSPQFADLRTYAQFKAKCIQVFQPKDSFDKFYNLQQLRTLKMQNSEFTYIADMRKVVDHVVRDIVANNNIAKIDGGPRNQMADIREVVSYISYGTLYAMLPEEYKAAFKKVPLDPREDTYTLLANLKEKICENKVRIDTEVTAVMQSKSVPPVRNNEKSPSPSNQMGKNNSSNPPQRYNNRGRTNQYKNNLVCLMILWELT